MLNGSLERLAPTLSILVANSDLPATALFSVLAMLFDLFDLFDLCHTSRT